MKYTIDIVRCVEQEHTFVVEADDYYDAMDLAESEARVMDWSTTRPHTMFLIGQVVNENNIVERYPDVRE